MELSNEARDKLLGDEETGLTRSFTALERNTVERVLSAVEARADRFADEGLSTAHFFAGVLNALLICGVWVGYPQHVWLLYLAEAAVLFPLRWHYQWIAKPLRESYFWCDFCWVANFAAAVVLLLVVADKVAYPGQEVISHSFREAAFCALWAIGCGPLAGAVAALGNALIFHSPNHWASLCIHLLPTLVLYTVRHETAVVTAAWPQVFDLDYFDKLSASQLLFCGLAFYGVWFVCFAAWMLVDGIRLPSRGYDTIFHANMRQQPALMRLRYKEEERKRRAAANDWKAADVLFYLVCHAAMCLGCFVFLSIPCFFSKPFHLVMIAVLVCSTVWNGATRYSYFLLETYTRIIRKQLDGFS